MNAQTFAKPLGILTVSNSSFKVCLCWKQGTYSETPETLIRNITAIQNFYNAFLIDLIMEQKLAFPKQYELFTTFLTNISWVKPAQPFDPIIFVYMLMMMGLVIAIT